LNAELSEDSLREFGIFDVFLQHQSHQQISRLTLTAELPDYCRSTSQINPRSPLDQLFSDNERLANCILNVAPEGVMQSDEVASLI
jgi:hypothetical protein